MKILLLVALILVVVRGGYEFSFTMDPQKIQNVTLEFRTSFRAYLLGIRCDSYSYSQWESQSYGFVQVYPEQRSSSGCSDKNFTLEISNDFTLDELTVMVYDYNTMTQLGEFNFLSDYYTVSKNELYSDKAAQFSLYTYDKNDFQFDITYPSTVYVEIYQCPKVKNYNTLKVKSYDENFQYRNVTSGYQNLFYDILNVTDGQMNYRIITNSNDGYPDIFIKYQRTYQTDLSRIQQYFKPYNTIQAEVLQKMVKITIPTVQLFTGRKVVFHIAISYDNYGDNSFLCSYGDSELENGLSNYYRTIKIVQQSGTYSQEVFLDFPLDLDGAYNIQVTAILDHGDIQQTVPYQRVKVYQNFSGITDQSLIYILAPIIVSVLGILGMCFGCFKVRQKKRLEEVQKQQHLMNQQTVNPIQYGIQ